MQTIIKIWLACLLGDDLFLCWGIIKHLFIHSFMLGDDLTLWYLGARTPIGVLQSHIDPCLLGNDLTLWYLGARTPIDVLLSHIDPCLLVKAWCY